MENKNLEQKVNAKPMGIVLGDLVMKVGAFGVIGYVLLSSNLDSGNYWNEVLTNFHDLSPLLPASICVGYSVGRLIDYCSGKD